jgi:hypothetical protein
MVGSDRKKYFFLGRECEMKIEVKDVEESNERLISL